MWSTVFGFLQAVLEFLLAPFIWLWKVLKDWFAGRLPAWAHWVLELTTLAIFVIILAIVNWQIGLDRYLAGPLQLRRVWLGIVAILLYLTIRLFTFLLKQLPKKEGEFSAIREAVQAGLDAATNARINIRDSPLFLVIGSDREVEEGLLKSSFVGEQIEVNGPELPVHWFGDADAVWVTVPGVSAISHQSVFATEVEQSSTPGSSGSGVKLNYAEKEQAYRRMQYLCKLLRKVRNPVVPINGILVTIPYAWARDPTKTALADTVKVDMVAAQNSLGIKCMCLVVFHGIERWSEFQSYIRRFPDSRRQRRCGCTMPSFTQHVESDNSKLHSWLCQFFRQQIYGFLASDRTNASNGTLFRFGDSIHRIADGFCRVLTNAFAVDIPEKFYFGGVYFAELSQAGLTFFDGVAAKLRADHDEVVGWNEQSLRRNGRLKAISSLLAGIVLLLLTYDAIYLGRLLLW